MNVRIWFIVRKVYSSHFPPPNQVDGLVYESALEFIQKRIHRNVHNPA